MTFKEWASMDLSFSPFGALDRFFKEVERQTLKSVRRGTKGVALSFPNYEVIINSILKPTIQLSPPGTIAAHTEYEGDLIEVDKGSRVFNAFAPLVGSTPGQEIWGADDDALFREILTKKIQDLSKWMGFAFEIEVYFYFIGPRKRLKDFFDKKTEVEIQYNKFIANIEKVVLDYYSKLRAEKSKKERYANPGANTQRRLGELERFLQLKPQQMTTQLLTMVQVHAVSVAEQFLGRAQSMLECPIDAVMFKGGESDPNIVQIDTADIVLLCSEEAEGVGGSLKFTSETKVPVRRLSLMTALDKLDSCADEFGKKQILSNLNPVNVQKPVKPTAKHIWEELFNRFKEHYKESIDKRKQGYKAYVNQQRKIKNSRQLDDEVPF